jgi:hypothetical protein
MVEPLGIDAVELPHPFGQVRVRRLHEQVIVVGHQTVGVPPPVEALANIGKQTQEHTPVAVIAIDILTRVTARGHVVQSAWKLESQRADHAPTLARREQKARPRSCFDPDLACKVWLDIKDALRPVLGFHKEQVIFKWNNVQQIH